MSLLVLTSNNTHDGVPMGETGKGGTFKCYFKEPVVLYPGQTVEIQSLELTYNVATMQESDNFALEQHILISVPELGIRSYNGFTGNTSNVIGVLTPADVLEGILPFSPNNIKTVTDWDNTSGGYQKIACDGFVMKGAAATTHDGEAVAAIAATWSTPAAQTSLYSSTAGYVGEGYTKVRAEWCSDPAQEYSEALPVAVYVNTAAEVTASINGGTDPPANKRYVGTVYPGNSITFEKPAADKVWGWCHTGSWVIDTEPTTPIQVPQCANVCIIGLSKTDTVKKSSSGTSRSMYSSFYNAKSRRPSKTWSPKNPCVLQTNVQSKRLINQFTVNLSSLSEVQFLSTQAVATATLILKLGAAPRALSA